MRRTSTSSSGPSIHARQRDPPARAARHVHALRHDLDLRRLVPRRRTGYEFGVNAAGVKMDQAIYDDGNEDGAWDAVWTSRPGSTPWAGPPSSGYRSRKCATAPTGRTSSASRSTATSIDTTNASAGRVQPGEGRTGLAVRRAGRHGRSGIAAPTRGHAIRRHQERVGHRRQRFTHKSNVTVAAT